MAMITFIIGVGVGVGTMLAALYLAIRLTPTIYSVASTARMEATNRESRGAFIEPVSREKEARDEIYERNASEGLDTHLSDFL